MQIDQNTKNKLGKIVELAKRGQGGERESAERLVRSYCIKYDLDFREVMEDSGVQKFRIKYRNKEMAKVLIFCVYRYAIIDMHGKLDNYRSKEIEFHTTKEKYIETLNAFVVLSSLYKKEKKKLEEAFVMGFRKKHNLYYQPTPEEQAIIDEHNKEKKLTKEEIERHYAAEKLAETMETAKLHRLLG